MIAYPTACIVFQMRQTAILIEKPDPCATGKCHLCQQISGIGQCRPVVMDICHHHETTCFVILIMFSLCRDRQPVSIHGIHQMKLFAAILLIDPSSVNSAEMLHMQIFHLHIGKLPSLRYRTFYAKAPHITKNTSGILVCRFIIAFQRI